MKTTMTKIALALSSLLAVVVCIIIIKALLLKSRQMNFKNIHPYQYTENAAAHLSQAIQFRTISSHASSYNPGGEFNRFHKFLERTYPLVHTRLSVENINRFGLLYTWQGSDSDLKPILFAAHQDVVPVEKGTESLWKYPPFSGTVAEGHVWGRGALDIKCSIISLMEAVEHLLSIGYRPRRTIYLAFGHDEEMSGNEGARKICRHLKSKGITLSMVMDEGGFTTEGLIPELKKPAAMIGIAEKGYLTLTLTARGEGGHSSMPPKQSTVGILSEAIHKLEMNPMPGAIEGVSRKMFQYIAPELSFQYKIALGNLWLFEPILKWQLSKGKVTNALIRTTTAATMFTGSEKENVLPIVSTAKINLRILPGESIDEVVDRVKKIINNNDIEITISEFSSEPSDISDIDSPFFTALHKTVKQVIPDVIVAPYLVFGATDSRHYRDIAENTYRFVPYILSADEMKGIHGTNERISMINLSYCIAFYLTLIQNLGAVR